jgi:hypothetical protein
VPESYRRSVSVAAVVINHQGKILVILSGAFEVRGRAVPEFLSKDWPYSECVRIKQPGPS